MEQNQTINQDYVYHLAAWQNNEQDSLIFAAKQSGLYRSTDSGQTWEDAYASLELNAPLPTTFVALAQTTEEKPVLFACVGGNVLRSFNRGEAWEYTELSTPAPVITSLVVSPDFATDGVLLMGTMQDGIFRSTNRGASWSGWNFGIFDPNINTLAISHNFADDQTILAGTQSCIFRSINAGRSWRDLDFPIELAPVLTLAIDKNGTIYAGTENEGLYTSHDDGKTWDQLLTGFVEQIYLDTDGIILIIRDSAIKYSKNGGKTWETRMGSGVESDISCLAAPLGLDPTHPLLVGLSTGKVTAI
jgi:photosystem II stability/assembly factor-like uncharacterized protein